MFEIEKEIKDLLVENFKYIKYLLDELPQFEEAKKEKELEKYMPWSKNLPKDIRLKRY